MSDEGRVMPVYVAVKVTSGAVALLRGKGALGPCRARNWHSPGPCQISCHRQRSAEPVGKPLMPGVYVNQRLSLGDNGKAYWGKAGSPTGLGKSDRPG
jgi:hypothetical protein